jgi:hypothetical protein
VPRRQGKKLDHLRDENGRVHTQIEKWREGQARQPAQGVAGSVAHPVGRKVRKMQRATPCALDFRPVTR